MQRADIAETFSAYSTFVTTFDNDNYDTSLPAANKIYSASVKKADERYPEEEKLVRTKSDQVWASAHHIDRFSQPRPQKAAGYSAQAYLDYVSWEREVKRPDVVLVKQLFERAIKDHPQELELWETYLEFLVSPTSPYYSR